MRSFYPRRSKNRKKKSVKSSSFLRFQGFAGVKAASKHVDEIDPGPGYVLHTFSSSNQDWISKMNREQSVKGLRVALGPT